jgi:FdhD protein
MTLPAPILPRAPLVWREDGAVRGRRQIPEETAVALTYGRATYAVMMATPADLEDFAWGFSRNEGLIAAADEIIACEIVVREVAGEAAVELRLDLGGARQEALWRRQRRLLGATGCGLCGMESLEAALEPMPALVSDLRLDAASLAAAMATLGARQVLNRESHALHAAAFFAPGRGIVAVREDVGRHNALDKLAGALLRAGIAPASGVVLLTSRVSVEMVQKVARMGCTMLLAVSAPTGLAVRRAERCGITLAAVARADGFEIFTHPERLRIEREAHVA